MTHPFYAPRYSDNGMNASDRPLIQTLTPARFVGWMANFIDAGYKGLLVKNGQLVREMQPGRYFNFAMPWLEQCQVVLIDIKTRNLELISERDFLSKDQFIVNVSLNVNYQVVNAKRIALELSDPLTTLSATLKDLMGTTIGQLTLQDLIGQGRSHVREYLLSNFSDIYQLGFQLEDVRVNDISFPEKRGILRQAEGMSARQEESYKAVLEAGVAKAGQPQIYPDRGVSPGNAPQVNVIVGADSPTVALPAGTPQPLPLAATELAPQPTLADPKPATTTYSLVHQQTAHRTPLSDLLQRKQHVRLGRELNNDLVVDDGQCSRSHAEITQSDGIYYVTDIGSANGTYLDGSRLPSRQPTLLAPGSALQIGNQVWRFAPDEAAVP